MAMPPASSCVRMAVFRGGANQAARGRPGEQPAAGVEPECGYGMLATSPPARVVRAVRMLLLL